ncbi:MAG: hypothetical protein JSS66_05945 [Armatimonadetes bacterium]|nr:hypothetical protein [Armatimonadota bacterium]
MRAIRKFALDSGLGLPLRITLQSEEYDQMKAKARRALAFIESRRELKRIERITYGITAADEEWFELWEVRFFRAKG